jgi:SAM-dependent methyltransferase
MLEPRVGFCSGRRMPDSHRARYDALPYRHGSIPMCAPARTGAIARMLGVAAVPPDRCRVLEIGCAEGMNLLPLAERFPDSQFTGIDFSPVQIANGERAREACGIENARLICADIRTFEPESGSFDYVIAHGIYSWVEADVRDRLLSLCAHCLAEGGVAYVSYNTQPGWAFTGGLREVLFSMIDRTAGVAQQAEDARKILHTFERVFAGEEGAQAMLMRESIAEMLGKPAALLMHDELAEVNTACAFLDFAAHAARHGMHYLAEAHYASMPFEHLKPETREAAADLATGFAKGQQVLDIVGARRFRNSLLTRAAIPEARAQDSAFVRECALNTTFRLEDPHVNLQPGAPMRVVGQHEVKLSLDHPFHKAFFATLIGVAPHRIPFPAAFAEARRQLERFHIEAEHSEEAICLLVQKFFTLDQVDLQLAGSGEWLRDRTPPEPGALMRWQARNAYPIVNRWHETVELQANEKRWLAGSPVRVDEKRMHAAGLMV